MKAVSKFSYMTIDGFTYFEPEEAMTYDEAMGWAKTRGLRLLTRGEWCQLYDHKEEFRKSCKPRFYWTASVCANNGLYVWFFNGFNGDLESTGRYGSYVVRAVQEDTEANYGY